MKKWLIIAFISVVSITDFYGQTDFYDVEAIREVKIYFQESNWDAILDSLFQTGDGRGRLLCNVMIDGIMYDSVGIRYKGYSSWDVNRVKNPFNIKLDYIISSQNHMGYDKIKLANVIHDPTFTREILSYDIARKYMPASKCNYANVYVNDTLIGLYTSSEAVNKDFVEKYFGSRSNPFFKGSPEHLDIPLGQNANLSDIHGTDSTAYIPYYDIESDYGWAALYNFIYILNEEPQNIEQVLNVDRALWMHAFNYSLLNLDSYIGYAQNYYIYKDDNGRFNTIPWDFNMSFGSFRNTDGLVPTTLPISYLETLDPYQHTWSSNRPLISSLISNDTYKRMYMAHIRTIVKENFMNNDYVTRGQYLQSIVDSAVQNDTNKFYTYNSFYENFDTTVNLGSSTYPGIISLMTARENYLTSCQGFNNYPIISNISQSSSSVNPGDEVWITAKIVNADSIFFAYRYDQFDIFQKIAMYDDGNHHDGTANDSVYGTSVVCPTNVQYYLYAENSEAGAFSPVRAEYEFYTINVDKDVVINEFLASNTSANMDYDDEYDDWLEIYNTGSSPVNLHGYFLSDDVGNLTKWAFPDTTINPDSYIVIWADADTFQQGLHCNFKISAAGGVLILSRTDTSLADNVSYAIQTTDISYGRYPNGTGPFIQMYPTYGKVNTNNLPIEDVKIKPAIKIFPNPAENYLICEITTNKFGDCTISLFNCSGQVILNKKLSLNQHVNRFVFDISTLKKGLYFVKVIDNSENMSVKKLIKN